MGKIDLTQFEKPKEGKTVVAPSPEPASKPQTGIKPKEEKKSENKIEINKEKKNRKILLILGIVGMLESSIFFFYEDLTFLGFILFSLSLWDILSYKKSEERFIQKFGTKEFFELKEKKEKAVQSFKRLEQISRAKEELQTLTFNEK